MTPPVVAPCPWCASECSVTEEDNGGVPLFYVACPNTEACEVRAETPYCSTAARAVEMWNTRPRPAVVDPVIVERASEIIAVTMFDSQVFGMQSMKRCVVDEWEKQPKDAQESIRRQSRLIAEQILALTAALGATGPEGEG